MATRKKESEKLVGVEPSRALSPFDDMEGWFKEMIRRPFPFFDLCSWPRLNRWKEVDQVQGFSRPV